MNKESIKKELIILEEEVIELRERMEDIKIQADDLDNEFIQEELNLKIKDLEDSLDSIEGTRTEVYTRIVGYFRAVEGWNKGKKEEYKDRKLFNQPDAAKLAMVGNEKILLFIKKNCPNCPPVIDFLSREVREFSTYEVDEDNPSIVVSAATKKYNVTSAPTVIFIDIHGLESARANNVDDLKKVLVGIIRN